MKWSDVKKKGSSHYTGNSHKRKCCRCHKYDDIKNLHITNGGDYTQYYHLDCLRECKKRWKNVKEKKLSF